MDPSKKRKRDDDEAETHVPPVKSIMTFKEWYDKSRIDIGYTSMPVFLKDTECSLRKDVIPRLHMLAQSLPVRKEQISMRNLLPHGFSAKYDKQRIREDTVTYNGKRITHEKALEYISLYQMAKHYHAIHTIKLKGGSILIVKPYEVVGDLFVTNSRISKISLETNALFEVSTEVMVMDLGELGPDHYITLATKTLSAIPHFEKSGLAGDDWSELRVAITKKNRKSIETVLGKASEQHIKKYIRAIDDIISAGSTLEDICKSDNLGVFTRKSLISLLTTQNRLKVPYKTKKKSIYLDSERATEVNPTTISKAKDDQFVLIMKNAMGHAAYGKLSGATNVYAVPSGSEEFFVPYGPKDANLSRRESLLVPVTDYKMVVTALSQLSVTKQSQSKDDSSEGAAAAAGPTAELPVAEITDAMFDDEL